MALSMITALSAAPGLLGTQEAIRQGQQKEKREEHRARRCNLIATCIKSSTRSREIDGRPLVLQNGKIFIDSGSNSDDSPGAHRYAGYYLPYPDAEYEGLVTTIIDAAPIMNWVYVDKSTYELKYGIRADAQPNLTGPFDCTRQDRRLTFQSWEGFCAVEESQGAWAVYFDIDDNGLVHKLPKGTRVLDIELNRKEKRWKKDVEARTEDQTVSRETKLDAQGQEVIIQPDAPKDLSIDKNDSKTTASEGVTSKPVLEDTSSIGQDYSNQEGQILSRKMAAPLPSTSSTINGSTSTPLIGMAENRVPHTAGSAATPIAILPIDSSADTVPLVSTSPASPLHENDVVASLGVSPRANSPKATSPRADTPMTGSTVTTLPIATSSVLHSDEAAFENIRALPQRFHTEPILPTAQEHVQKDRRTQGVDMGTTLQLSRTPSPSFTTSWLGPLDSPVTDIKLPEFGQHDISKRKKGRGLGSVKRVVIKAFGKEKQVEKPISDVQSNEPPSRWPRRSLNLRRRVSK